MTINQSGWRPSTPEAGEASNQTYTGNRALMLEEPLLFEIGSTDQTGVDIDLGDRPRRDSGRSSLQHVDSRCPSQDQRPACPWG